MGCERVAKAVRCDAGVESGTHKVLFEESTHTARGQAAAAMIEENCAFGCGAIDQFVAADEVAIQGGNGLGAKWDDALFVAFSDGAHPAFIQVNVGNIE